MGNSPKWSEATRWAYCEDYPQWGWLKVLALQKERVQLLLPSGQPLALDLTQHKVHFSSSPQEPVPQQPPSSHLLFSYLQGDEREREIFWELLRQRHEEELLVPLWQGWLEKVPLLPYQRRHLENHIHRLQLKWQHRRLPPLPAFALSIARTPLPLSPSPKSQLPFFQIYWHLAEELQKTPPQRFFPTSWLVAKLLHWALRHQTSLPSPPASLLSLSALEELWRHFSPREVNSLTERLTCFGAEKGAEVLWLSAGIHFWEYIPSSFWRQAEGLFPEGTPLWELLESLHKNTSFSPSLSTQLCLSPLECQLLLHLPSHTLLPAKVLSQLWEHLWGGVHISTVLQKLQSTAPLLPLTEQLELYRHLAQWYQENSSAISKKALEPLLGQWWQHLIRQGLLPTPLPHFPSSPLWKPQTWEQLSSSRRQQLLEELNNSDWSLKKDPPDFLFPSSPAHWNWLLEVFPPRRLPVTALASSPRWQEWLLSCRAEILRLRHEKSQQQLKEEQLFHTWLSNLEHKVLPLLNTLSQRPFSPFRGQYERLQQILKRHCQLWRSSTPPPNLKTLADWDQWFCKEPEKAKENFSLEKISPSLPPWPERFRQIGSSQLLLLLALQQLSTMSPKEGRRWVRKRLRKLAEQTERQEWYSFFWAELLIQQRSWLQWFQDEPKELRQQVLLQMYQLLVNTYRDLQTDSLSPQLLSFIRDISPLIRTLESELSHYEELRQLLEEALSLTSVEPELGKEVLHPVEGLHRIRDTGASQSWRVRTRGWARKGEVLEPSDLEGS